MKTLELEEMEIFIGGGCGATMDKAISTAGFIAGLASFAGPIGAMIAGPTAVGMGIASIYCAYR